MKKFIIASVIAVIALFIARFCVYYLGFYIDFHPDREISASVTTQAGEILVKKGEDFQPLQIKGVDMDSSIPGHFATDFAIDEETYLRWFSMIQEMGANTVRVYTIMDDDFYNAFYRYNRGREEPLYLLQGIWVTDYANNSAEDAYGKDFYPVLKRDAVAAVDVVHGRKDIALNREKGSGNYRRDVSDWVLGYILGLEWNSRTIAYTDHLRGKPGGGYLGFDGEYVKTAPEATAFESMLADVMDHLLRYESRKYKEQRLVSFINDPSNDPFEWAEEYGSQVAKYVRLDAEHILMKDTVKSGYFASYRLYEFCPGFADCFSEEEKGRLADILPRLDTGRYYEGYSQLLSEYHTMPVVITGYGFSSARGVDQEREEEGREKGPLTEEEQGEALIGTYQDIVESGCAGAVISVWQDVWGQRSWNTIYAVDVTNAPFWSDTQTMDQGYGLLAFEPGREKPVCLVDGDKSEWEKKQALGEYEGVRISAQYDEKYIYFLIEKQGLSEEESIYVPIDTTPKSGSFYCSDPELTFERNADFLLCIQGRENSRLLVQERYEALRENYLMETQGLDPFSRFPKTGSPGFVKINMILKVTGVLEEGYDEAGAKVRRLAPVYETGKLTHGNADPDSGGYLSTADFCYGPDCVEIRLPWQLLNFSDPSHMMIHDDYYLHYGVENIKIKECFVGALPGEGSKGTAPMYRLDLNGWGRRVSYHERLKKSYGILKDYWTQGERYAD